MSTQYGRYPAQVLEFASFSNFPSSAPNGTLAVALDTSFLYIYNSTSMSWVDIGGSGVPLGIGTYDSKAAVANGLQIVANLLYGQSSDATHPGMVSIGTQTFAGQKTFSTGLTGTLTGSASLNVLTSSLGNLTDAGTDGIIVTGGTGAVVGSVSLAQHVADTTHNGYLSSTDWNTFNGKQAAGNYITALTGDATATGPGSVALTLATVNGNVGSFGSSTSIPSFTVNAKGLITAASGNAVIAPAGTLSGTTLNATVVSSSLTSLGSQSQALNMNSHLINNVTDPVSAQDAATKNYVDTVSSQLQPLQAVQAASTATISGTYSNGAAGIGATFTTTATTNFTLDGVTPALLSRVLLKDQTSGFQNGVYTLTTQAVGGVSGAILTRALDYDTSTDINAGDLIPVINGTVNATTSWLQTATITTVGTDSLVFVQWTANPGSYLLKANNLSDVASKSTSFNNLSPMTTGGDIIYGGASGAGTRLANGSSGQVLTSNGGTSAPSWQASSSSTLPIAVLREEDPSGTDGGTFTSGSWQTRVLNTKYDPNSIISSFSSNQFALVAGTYLIEASAPAFAVNRHKAKIANITDSTDAIIGQSAYSDSGGTAATDSLIQSTITIAGTKTFQLQHQCQTTKTTNGFGLASSFSVVEVYSQVTITKIG